MLGPGRGRINGFQLFQTNPSADCRNRANPAPATRSQAGLCDGIEIVFPSVGITQQKDGLTYKDSTTRRRGISCGEDLKRSTPPARKRRAFRPALDLFGP